LVKNLACTEPKTTQLIAYPPWVIYK